MKLGLQGELRASQKVLYQAAAISYYMIGSSVDFEGIQRELDMPDVYASFGRIVFLHMWFLLVRYIQLGECRFDIGLRLTRLLLQVPPVSFSVVNWRARCGRISICAPSRFFLAKRKIVENN